MAVTAEAVKVLRERTGAGMMECKKALVETNGDLDAAAELMRKSGLAKADKKAARVAAEGVVAVALRIVFTVVVATLLSTPFLKIIGGCLLLWIAVKLVRGEEEGGDNIQASDRLFHAVKTIAIASSARAT